MRNLYLRIILRKNVIFIGMFQKGKQLSDKVKKIGNKKRVLSPEYTEKVNIERQKIWRGEILKTRVKMWV